MKEYVLCNRILQLPDWIDEERVTTNQAPIVEEVVSRFEEGNGLVILDAPTGAGKSLLAEMVRQAIGTKATYLTHSLVLQDQLLHDFPDTSITIKGRANYTPQIPFDESDNAVTCADCTFDFATELCDFCPMVHECSYRVQKQIGDDTPSLIANYAYFFGEVRGRHSICKRDLVIADEADCLEGELLNHVQIDISPSMQRRLRLLPPEKKTKQEAWQDWFEYAVPHVKKELERMPNRTVLQKRSRRSVQELFGKLSTVKDNLDGWIYDGYTNKADTSFITFKPIRVDKVAPYALWRHGKRWLAMSATIISPEEFVESLGYEGPWAAVWAPSTFPRERRPINYVPVASVTNKTKVDAYPKLADAIKFLLETRPDRVLIHSQSYDLTRHLFDELVTLNRNVVTYLNSKAREEAIASYDNTEGSVLIAPSLERGFDGKGDRCRHVIVCKLPYAYLGDKQVNARLYSKGGQLWYATNVARTLTQQIGRGMRSETDFAETIILDAQFEKFYREWSYRDEPNSIQRAHRLFPDWFVEAIDWSSDAKFELRAKQRERGSKATASK